MPKRFAIGLTGSNLRVDQIREQFDERFVRMWRLYLAGSVAAFASGCLQLYQVVFTNGPTHDVPRTREHLYDSTNNRIARVVKRFEPTDWNTEIGGVEEMMNSYDAIVIGAGPAGSTCAGRLKSQGLTVKLLDKKTFPRVKPCAGWVTPQVIEALRVDLEDYRREHTLQPITGFRTGIIGGRTAETRFKSPVSFGILRVEFDNYLLQHCGVVCDFRAVKEIHRNNERWLINGEFEAKVIVGAGGHFCPVSRLLNDPTKANGPEPIVVYAQEIEFELAHEENHQLDVDPEIPELYFCRDLQGYGWCFRKGNYLNVGLGRLEKNDLTAHVAEFWEFLRSQKKVLTAQPNHFLGHAYRLYAERKPILVDERALLIGDAAGLAYPHSGEGIRPAVESAIIAADVIAESNPEFTARVVNRLSDSFAGTVWSSQTLPGRQLVTGILVASPGGASAGQSLVCQEHRG